MNSLKFLRIVVFPVLAVVTFVFALSPVEALEYDLKMELDITLTEDLTAVVKQNVTVINKSDEFLSSSLSMDIPFSEVKSLQVESSGEKLPASIENRRLWVDFSSDPLDYREQKVLNIKYELPKFVEDRGSVHTFMWPKFNVEEESSTYAVKFNYPIEWEDVIYSSQGIDASHAFDTRRGLVFESVDKPIRIYTGDYTLKETEIVIDELTKNLGREVLNVPLQGWHYLVGDQDSITLTSGNGYTRSQVNLKKYFEHKQLAVISKETLTLSDEVVVSSYFEGVNRMQGLLTEDPAKLYQIVLSRLQPSKNISQWSRETVGETLNKQTQNDLDYANTLSAVFSSKDIPTQIVYGIARYPDGKYYWHFWNMYQERDGQRFTWKEVDPYLEDLSGHDYFRNVPPERMVWGVLGAESSLIDFDTDLLYISSEGFAFRNFDSPSTQTGYITSQLNRKAVNTKEKQSVLGIGSVRKKEGGMGYAGGAVVSVVAGFVLISFARYFDYSEKKYKVKLKTQEK